MNQQSWRSAIDPGVAQSLRENGSSGWLGRSSPSKAGGSTIRVVADWSSESGSSSAESVCSSRHQQMERRESVEGVGVLSDVGLLRGSDMSQTATPRRPIATRRRAHMQPSPFGHNE